MNDTLSIRQVYYGSTTGRSNYQILCASAGVSDEAMRLVDQHANLGGSALAGKNPQPIYACYRVGDGVMAFAMTGFPSEEMGPRGNDYLVHVLILDEAVLSLLRGQIFLLAHLFNTQTKPEKKEDLPPIVISRREYDEKSAKPGSTWLKPGFSDEFLAFLLTRLTMGSVAALSRKPEQNMALCQSLFALLTPDDRMRFSFCTHFSYNRHLNYKFTLFPEVDRELAERYQARGGAAIIEKMSWPENSDMSKDRMLRWIERVRGGMEPLFGLSLLGGVRDALELDQALTAMNKWIDRDKGESPLNRLDPEVRDLLLKIGRDRFNRHAPRVAPIFEFCILESYRDRVARHLASGSDGLPSIRKDALNIRRVIEADAVKAAVLGKTLLRSGGVTPSNVAAIMALVLYLPQEPVLKHIYHPSIDLTLFRGPDEACQPLMELMTANRPTATSLVAAWISLWRERAPGRAYDTWASIIQAAVKRYPSKVDLFWKVFLDANLVSLKEMEPAARQDNLNHLIDDLMPRIPKVFSSDEALDLVVKGDLLHGLQPAVSERIMSKMLRRHAVYLTKKLTDQPVFNLQNLKVLDLMMAGCSNMLQKDSLSFPRKRTVPVKFWDLIMAILNAAKVNFEAYANRDLSHFAQRTLSLILAASQNMALDRLSKDLSTSRFTKDLSDMLYFLVTRFPINQDYVPHIVRHLTASASPEERRLLQRCLVQLKDTKDFVSNRPENRAFLENLLVGIRKGASSRRKRGGRP